MPLTPLITAQIPPQNFELVRDQIGAILLVELANQYIFNQDPSLLPSSVDIERFMAVDDSKFPVIIVSLGSGKYHNKDYGGNVTGTYDYYIDIYTGSASTAEEGGDQLAAIALEKLMGMCRYILDNPQYCTLGFDPKTSGMQIQVVSVEDFHINPLKKTENASDFICGSMKLCVTVPETAALLNSIRATGADVTVTLDTSGKYYKWIINE